MRGEWLRMGTGARTFAALLALSFSVGACGDTTNDQNGKPSENGGSGGSDPGTGGTLLASDGGVGASAGVNVGGAENAGSGGRAGSGGSEQERPLTIVTPLLPDARADTPYSTMFAAEGGDANSYTWSLGPTDLGAPPTGLSFTDEHTGLLTGTPAFDRAEFEVEVRDALGNVARKTFAIYTITPQWLAYTAPSADLRDVRVLATYLSATGASAPIVLSDAALDSDLYFSPNGRFVAFVDSLSWDSKHVHVADLSAATATGAHVYNLGTVVSVHGLAWSPDSATFSWVAQNTYADDPTLHLTSMQKLVGGQDAELLTHASTYRCDLRWLSPERLYYRNADFGLSWIDRAGSDFEFGQFADVKARFSTMASRYALLDFDDWGRFETVDLETGQLFPLEHVDDGEWNASPDLRLLARLDHETDKGALYRVTDGQITGEPVVWDGPSHAVAWANQSAAVVAIGWDTATLYQLENVNISPAFTKAGLVAPAMAMFSPNDAYVAIADAAGALWVANVPPAGQTTEPQLATLNAIGESLQFAPDSRTLVYVTRDGQLHQRHLTHARAEDSWAPSGAVLSVPRFVYGSSHVAYLTSRLTAGHAVQVARLPQRSATAVSTFDLGLCAGATVPFCGPTTFVPAPAQ